MQKMHFAIELIKLKIFFLASRRKNIAGSSTSPKNIIANASYQKCIMCLIKLGLRRPKQGRIMRESLVYLLGGLING
jgi:hypothetical protein